MRRLFGGELPRLVMFDLDGTLLDSVPDLAAAVDSMLQGLGRPPAGAERVREWVGNDARALVRRALANAIEHAGVSEAETVQALELFLAAYAGEHHLSRVYPGVRELLDALRDQDVPLALITNKPQRFLAELLVQKGLDGYFRWTLGGDSLPVQKPDPGGLLHVLGQARVAPEQALFIGDSRNDVLAAKAAGVPCVAVSYGYNHGRPVSEEGADLLVDDLRLLLP